MIFIYLFIYCSFTLGMGIYTPWYTAFSDIFKKKIWFLLPLLPFPAAQLLQFIVELVRKNTEVPHMCHKEAAESRQWKQTSWGAAKPVGSAAPQSSF